MHTESRPRRMHKSPHRALSWQLASACNQNSPSEIRLFKVLPVFPRHFTKLDSNTLRLNIWLNVAREIGSDPQTRLLAINACFWIVLGVISVLMVSLGVIFWVELINKLHETDMSRPRALCRPHFCQTIFFYSSDCTSYKFSMKIHLKVVFLFY